MRCRPEISAPCGSHNHRLIVSHASHNAVPQRGRAISRARSAIPPASPSQGFRNDEHYQAVTHERTEYTVCSRPVAGAAAGGRADVAVNGPQGRFHDFDTILWSTRRRGGTIYVRKSTPGWAPKKIASAVAFIRIRSIFAPHLALPPIRVPSDFRKRGP